MRDGSKKPRRTQSTHPNQTRLKIAYIGKFDRLWDEEGIALGLESAGAEVLRVHEKFQSTEKLKQQIEEFNPDFVLGAKYDVVAPETLFKWLRSSPYPTVSWTFDLLLGHPNREPRIRWYHFLSCDYVFLTDGGHNKEYKKIGVNPLLLRQGIPDEYCYMAEPTEGPEIVFVGSFNAYFPYRQKLLTFLEETYGDRFQWIGAGDSNECRGHDLNTLYASAKIVIGDCMHGAHYWSNRVVETLGRGGFLIHPEVKGIEQEYTPYQEFIPYSWGDFAGIKQKIDYYLTHDKERDAIRTAGFNRVQKEYKISDRCHTLLTFLKNEQRNIQERVLETTN